jgi:dimethylhistidine N-methyltransferase
MRNPRDSQHFSMAQRLHSPDGKELEGDGRMKTRACCAALVALMIQSHDGGRTCYSGGEAMPSPASAFLGVPAPIESAPRGDAELAARVLAGLAESPKRIDPVWLYDERGAALFDRLCAQPEYYLTRAELALMDAHAAEIAACIGPVAALIEFGSSTSLKTRLLLEELDSPVAYMPVDVARTPLMAASRTLAARFPDIAVLPVCADFTQPVLLPDELADVKRRIVYIAGSTIGNFCQDEATGLLAHMRELAGPAGAVLVSIDDAKDRAMMERAYNDSAGVTAEFNRNVLAHINHRLGGDFDVRRFVHRAVWVDTEQRIEMRLKSACEQIVRVGGREVLFEHGEELITKYCYKYLAGQLPAMGQAAGLRPQGQWTNEPLGFSVQLLEPETGDPCRPLEAEGDIETEARSGCRIAF